MSAIKVNSPNVTYTKDYIEAQYDYQTTSVSRDIHGSYIATPTCTRYTFKTERRVPKLGVMLVGWGGNNGSTVTAAVLANKHNMEWYSKEGLHTANFFGSITQASTVCLGTGPEGEIFVPMKDLLPMVDPENIVFDGELFYNYVIYCMLILALYANCPYCYLRSIVEDMLHYWSNVLLYWVHSPFLVFRHM